MKKYVLGFVLFIAVSMLWATREYRIGDTGPGCGIVFYVSKKGFKVYDGSGGSMICHYLEMSKDVLGESKWFPEYGDIGGTHKGLGYGKANTYKILLNAKRSKMLTEENCAAYRASKYSTATTKAGDWWLPSLDELIWMFINQEEHLYATSTRLLHWSSSECDAKEAWARDTSGSFSLCHSKIYFIYSVRAVRAF